MQTSSAHPARHGNPDTPVEIRTPASRASDLLAYLNRPRTGPTEATSVVCV